MIVGLLGTMAMVAGLYGTMAMVAGLYGTMAVVLLSICGSGIGVSLLLLLLSLVDRHVPIVTDGSCLVT